MHPTWKNFITEQGAVLIDGRISHFGDPSVEQQAAKNDTILADISDNTVIAIKGEDAESFLHGQFTNDVKKLDGTNWQRNGYCSPKGRLLATFHLWKQQDYYLLQLPSALRESIQKRLTMFVLRAKVKLTDVSEETVRIGVAGPKAEALIQAAIGSPVPQPNTLLQKENVTVLGLGQNRFEILAPPEQAITIWQALNDGNVKVGADRWEWLAICAGEPMITTATQEQFVPQMINFEIIGGVNFQKGCYPGQEIVARTQYLGKLKRRMYLVNIAADAVAAGDSLFSSELEGQTSGTIVNAARSPNGGFDCLAVVQGESIDNRIIHFQSLDGPALQLLSLPYALP
jgi:hypothetical protein